VGLESSRREAEERTAEALRLLPGDGSFGLLDELLQRMLERTH
jgi:hypothetical protein